jgi:hypothetical protein
MTFGQLDGDADSRTVRPTLLCGHDVYLGDKQHCTDHREHLTLNSDLGFRRPRCHHRLGRKSLCVD